MTRARHGLIVKGTRAGDRDPIHTLATFATPALPWPPFIRTPIYASPVPVGWSHHYSETVLAKYILVDWKTHEEPWNWPSLKSALRPPPSAQAESANFRPFYVKRADFSPPPLQQKKGGNSPPTTHRKGGFWLLSAFFFCRGRGTKVRPFCVKWAEISTFRQGGGRRAEGGL